MNSVENIINEQYEKVCVLSKKENSQVIVLKHKTLEKNIVLRKFSGNADVYKILQKIKEENIPEVLSVVTEMMLIMCLKNLSMELALQMF